MATKDKSRILYLDIMRLVAAVGVMFIHFSNRMLGSAELGSMNWYLFVIFNCLGRFAVPIFFMISGSLFLDPDRNCDLGKLFRNNILRLIIALYFWSVGYAGWNLVWKLQSGPLTAELIKATMKSLITGPTHLWFLFVLIGLYMLTPFLRKIAESRKMTEYFLVLWVIFGMIPAFLDPVSGINFIGEYIRKFQLRFVAGYSGYFLLGYYLRFQVNPSLKTKKIIYIVGMLAYVFTCASTAAMSFRTNTYNEMYLDAITPNCLFMAIAVFVGIKGVFGDCSKHPHLKLWVYRIAEYSMGIYLCHMIVFEMLDKMGIVKIFNESAIGLVIVTVFVYVLGYGLSYVLKKIPGLGKYIV